MPFKDKETKKEFQRKWVDGRRNKYLIGKSCVKCKSTDDLHLVYIDPKTKVSRRIWSWKDERIIGEMKKCQFYCKSCHQEKINSDHAFGLKHGTKRGYGYYGCKCDLCVKANANAVKSFRDRKGKDSARLPDFYALSFFTRKSILNIEDIKRSGAYLELVELLKIRKEMRKKK